MRDQQLDGLAIYHGFLSGYISISGDQNYLNRINVFPVADGDTGTNMVRTFRAVAAGLQSSRSAAGVLTQIADLALRGARGNSGAILSQFLNGLAESAASLTTITVHDLGNLARKAITYAYGAMDRPVEGTILTVIRVWADTLHAESRTSTSIADLLRRGLSSAKNALERTPEQLDVLRTHGVVDAGASGFVRFLEGAVALADEGPIPLSLRKKLQTAPVPMIAGDFHLADQAPGLELTHRYCTEVFVEGMTVGTEEVKDLLRAQGDSLIVSSRGSNARVHLHTDNPELTVNTCRRIGSIAEQKVDDMFRQTQAGSAEHGRIAVLTDSIADIPGEVLDQYGIHVLNQSLIWGDDEYLDRLTISPETFYKQQQLRKDFPSSAVPDQDRVSGLYHYLLANYSGVIVLPVAASLSGTWQLLARTAREHNEPETRIQVVDTCLNSAAQGLLVTEVAKAATRGAGLGELTELAESLKKRVKIYVSVSTFKFMVRGGRLSPLKGFIAAMLNLKPIVSLDSEGRGVAFGKAFSGKGLLRRIERIIRETDQRTGIERFAVVHAASPAAARRFSGIVTGVLGREPEYITEISPIVGMHSGKGAIAIGLIEEAQTG